MKKKVIFQNFWKVAQLVYEKKKLRPVQRIGLVLILSDVTTKLCDLEHGHKFYGYPSEVRNLLEMTSRLISKSDWVQWSETTCAMLELLSNKADIQSGSK